MLEKHEFYTYHSEKNGIIVGNRGNVKEEQNGKYTFGFHIILRSGSAEFVWGVKDGKEVLLGSPWGVYAKRIIVPSYRIKLPFFGTYEDLEEILRIAFGMYEDF